MSNEAAIDRPDGGSRRAQAVALRLARFGISGVISTVLYFALASLLVWLAPLPVALASFLAFAGSGVASYLLHRSFTFGGRDRSARSVRRFVSVNVAANAVAILVPWIVCDIAGYRPLIGILLVCAIVPVMTFVLLSVYVFRAPSAGDASAARGLG